MEGERAEDGGGEEGGETVVVVGIGEDGVGENVLVKQRRLLRKTGERGRERRGNKLGLRIFSNM